jgi:peptide/nickel transport system permease protein
VVTEVVFDWPGIGNLFLSAIIARDFPLIQAVVGLVAVTVLSANLIVDLLYGVVDPRIRFATRPMQRAAAKG